MERNGRLKQLRQSFGYTQERFAEELGVTRAALSNYELGRREPDSNFFKKLKERFKLNDQAIGEILLEYAKKKNVSTDN